MATGPEAKIQISIIKWLRTVMPKVMIQHCKNEHYKRGKAGMIAGSMNKAAGVLSGFPDLICFTYAGVFCLEVKTKTGKVSPVQEQVHDMLRERGIKVAVVRSIDDTRAFLQEAGIGFNEVQF